MKILNDYIFKLETIPQDLLAALPQITKYGDVKFPKGGYHLLFKENDVRVLPALISVLTSAPNNVTYIQRSRFQKLFGLGSTNKSKIRLQVLIENILISHQYKLVMQNPWCIRCYIPAVIFEKSPSILPIKTKWIFCPNCLDNQHLRSISHLTGLLGMPLVPDDRKLYSNLWDNVERSVLYPERAFDVLEIYPGLGEQLDWALTAVVTALQNTSRGVPPIHLHTTEPLTENTRRLIAPYLI